MKVCHVVGARPNYMKAAPVMRALRVYSNVQQVLIHTGQHYDFNMSEVFFQQLQMAHPDVNLQVGSGTQAHQTAQIMMRIEPVLQAHLPDIVLVYGDVNSTLAAALVCVKLGIPVGHVEAGLRAFDRSMPEEINRILTDRMADKLFTPSEDGDKNLRAEGISADKIYRVGNVMIDTLLQMLPLARKSLPVGVPERFILLTLHRPSNVDDSKWLSQLLVTVSDVAADLPVLFPVHPRTRRQLESAEVNVCKGRIQYLEPLPYLEFLAMEERAAVVITDSGGVQEETTYLKVPCVTVRDNTERPVTVTTGTNALVGRNLGALRERLECCLRGDWKQGQIPPLWDGDAASRIAAVLCGHAAGSANAAKA